MIIIISKKVKRKVIKRKLRSEWLSDNSWLKFIDESTMICQLCHVNISISKSHLNRHKSSNAHKRKMDSAAKTPDILALINKKSTQEPTRISNNAELKCIAFLVEHNLPLRLMDHIPGFLGIFIICQFSSLSFSLKNFIYRKCVL